METTFEKFLDMIHMNQDKYTNYQDLKLIKVKINSKKNLINLFLEASTMLDLESFKGLLEKTKEYFNSNVFINIKNLGDKSLYLEDYFKYFLPKYISYFNDRLKVNG